MTYMQDGLFFKIPFT